MLDNAWLTLPMNERIAVRAALRGALAGRLAAARRRQLARQPRRRPCLTHAAAAARSSSPSISDSGASALASGETPDRHGGAAAPPSAHADAARLDRHRPRRSQLSNPTSWWWAAPYNDDGSPGAHCSAAADRFARALAQRYGLPVARVDERYSSTEAAEPAEGTARLGRAPPARAARGHRQRGGGGDPASAGSQAAEGSGRHEGQSMSTQRRPDGSLRHLITLEGLSRAEIEPLLERAAALRAPRSASAAVATAALAGSPSPTCSPSPRRARACPSSSPAGASAPRW